jgi:hypothetical protein
MSDDAASWQTTSVRRGCGNHRIEASRLDPLAVGAHDGAVCREVDGEQPDAVKRRTRPRRGPGGELNAADACWSTRPASSVAA